ncbi:phage integrase family protein [Listeria booriae]|uniref:tyrosine-type recombinase/integrase n=1 Tax=Listeria booriae TaxID=1552123 RepID=UPI001627EB39|nr:tyrosine-type recombinase/integrase [Listeria booriae]MBC2316955.1 phage integrase family protein [Listeria booriae]
MLKIGLVEGSVQSIDISKELYNMLEKLITKQKAIKFATGAFYHNEKFIFAKANGYPQHAKQIANRLSRILKLCKIEDKYTPHSFRHSYATLLEELQLPQVYKQLGHSSFETTQNTYIHITDNIKKEASAKVNNLAKSFLQ